MNCRDFNECVVDYTRKELSPEKRKRVEDHATACSACAMVLEEETALAARLEDIGRFLEDVQPSPHLEEGLMEAFRQRQRSSSSAGSGLSSLAWLAAAALIMVTFATVLYQTQVAGPAETPRPTAIDRGEASVYSDFIPLGNCVSLDCLDRAQLMRIDLPRSSVQYFGIPSNRFEFEGERIKADVLVGEDGIARAIRFVY